MEEKRIFQASCIRCKTRDNIIGMDSIFHGFSKIDEEFVRAGRALIMGDLGYLYNEILEDAGKSEKTYQRTD